MRCGDQFLVSSGFSWVRPQPDSHAAFSSTIRSDILKRMAKSVDVLPIEDELDYTPASADCDPLELVIPAELAGRRLDQALALLMPTHSRSRLQTWIKAGLVNVDGVDASAKAKVWGGEVVHVRPQLSAEEVAFRPENIPLDVVHEDAALLVINKPAGQIGRAHV